MIAGLASTALLAACGDDMMSSAAANSGAAATAKPASQLAIGNAKEWMYAAGEVFTVGAFRLKLAGVEQLPVSGERPAALRTDTFFAVFDILAGGPMAEGAFRIMPSAGPAFDIFLSPSVGGELRMTALFN